MLRVSLRHTLHGWPLFRLARILVALVLENLAAGISVEEWHADDPPLPEEVVAAAFAYAAELARGRELPADGMCDRERSLTLEESEHA